MKKNLVTDAVKQLIDKFPNAGNLTLAKILRKESPALFSSIEHARSAVRRLRGANGAQKRAYRTHLEYRKPLGVAGEGIEPVPKGIRHLGAWNSVNVSGPAVVGLLCDLHCPYHREDMVEIAFKHLDGRGVDTILLGGDLTDMFALSYWENDPRLRDFPREVEVTRRLLKTLRGRFPKARIIWKEGNHEERLGRYMRRRAPELLGVDVFQEESIYELGDLGVEYVRERRIVRLGKLPFLHGHEYGRGVFNPVNPARGLFLKAKTICACGHYHQSSEHSSKTVNGKVLSTFSTGCLCDLHPEFRPINDWNWGFAVVEVASGGAFKVDNLKIIDGQVY